MNNHSYFWGAIFTLVDYKDSSKRRTNEYNENQKQTQNMDYNKNNLKLCC
jgi:hypothetical protein